MNRWAVFRHLRNCATWTAAPKEQTPWTLLDYFPDDYLLFVDESHITCLNSGHVQRDRARKQTLVDYGFLAVGARQYVPRSLVEQHVRQVVAYSATPARTRYEHSRTNWRNGHPAHGLDDRSVIDIRPKQRSDRRSAPHEIKRRVDAGQRAPSYNEAHGGRPVTLKWASAPNTCMPSFDRARGSFARPAAGRSRDGGQHQPVMLKA